ncbi:MAG TPA: HEAT repeat domain-containing protein [Candidatus Acidoferrales bacterium]|nr:HEAT repeat domain-containing protein [Candidatus Acidoferrales bacterium]
MRIGSRPQKWKAAAGAFFAVIAVVCAWGVATRAQGEQQDARIQRLFSKDAAVRSAAKADLLQHPDPALLPSLLKELPASQGTNRDDLVEVLAKYDDTKKIPVFFAMRPWSGSVADVGEINLQLSHLGQPAADALVAHCTETNDNYADWAAGVLNWMHQIGARQLVESVQSDDACKHEMGTQGLLYMTDPDQVARAETQLASDAAVDPDERIRGAARQWFATWNGKEEQIDCGGIIEPLIAAYQAKAPSATMVKIAQMLATVDRPRVTRFMRAAVHSPNAEIQEIAKNYLSMAPAEPAAENKSPQTPAQKIEFIKGVGADDMDANTKIAPLVSDADASVRTAAASALGTLNAPSMSGQDTPSNPDTALDALRKAAKDSSPQVRAAAVGAIGDMRSSDQNDSAIVVAALSDSDASVRLAAVDALQQTPTDAAVPALTKIYRDQQSSQEIRAEALVTLRTICSPDSTPVFLEALQARNGKPSQDVAEGLACTLQKRPDKDAFAPILKALQAVNPGPGPQDSLLESSLMDAMAETKNPGAFGPLAERLKSQNRWTRRSAAGALGLLGDRRAIPLLAGLLNDMDDTGHLYAASALKAFSDFPAPPELIAMATNKNASMDTLDALVASHDPKAIDAMIAAMPKNPGVIYALGEAHDTRAVPALISYMQNPANDAGPRSTAASSLGKIGDARAVEPLIASLADDNGQIVMQVSAALAMLKDKRAIVPLQQAMARWSTGQHQNAETVKVWIRQALTQLGAQ